jgi:uncharacterized protein YeaO (DUF488 family)
MPGVIVYEGPSEIDGKPIVCVAVWPRGKPNAKTGRMVQVYILPQGECPTVAVKSGSDTSVCGDCKRRPLAAHAEHGVKRCYVVHYRGPRSVYAAWKRGRYEHGFIPPGSYVRFGAWGDPTAVPSRAIRAQLWGAAGWTGYTHRWSKELDDRDFWRGLLHASCDSVAERASAKGLGWRTFRARGPQESILPGESVCPASAEAGKTQQCIDCLACCGTMGLRSKKSSRDRVIIEHR